MDRLRKARRAPEYGAGSGKTLDEALAKSRFELVPMEGAKEQAAHLPEGAKVTVTCSPKRGIEGSLLLAEELSEMGFRVVPHISARLVSGGEHLKGILRRLTERDVREIFVIGGDVKESAGPFSSAFELLSAIANLGYDFEHVGIAGYPERHPFISDDALRRALRDKQSLATHIVTQMCFDPREILNWAVGIREQGIELPVYVGLPGAVDRKKLLRISLKIGVGDSARFLSKNTSLVAKFLRSGGYSPDRLVNELAPYVGDLDYGIAGFHFFTFNQVEKTEEWRRRILDLQQ